MRARWLPALALLPALAARAESDPRAPATGSALEALHYLRDPPELPAAARSDADRSALERLITVRERAARAHRGEAIALLERFVADTPESAAELPDALLRLAELRWEDARADYLRAMSTWQAAPAGSRGEAPPLPDHARSLALYDRLIARHADFARLDLVLYMKALALMEANQVAGALPLFTRILGEYPRSRFRPDAHMALAEHQLLDLHDYAAALAEYDRVLAYEQSSLHDLALFKSGWCLWQLGKRGDAALRFRRVIDVSRAADSQRARHQKDLKSEALAYLIQVFSEDEQNRAADVEPFLRAIGGERHLVRVLSRLSETYYDQARFDRGVEAYALLLAREPDAPRAPQRQRQLARGYLALGRFDEALAAYRTLVIDFAPGTRWAKHQRDAQLVLETRSESERALREQALSLHERGQRDDDRTALVQAVAFYRLYLATYPREPESYRSAFYLGDLLHHRLERDAEAGEAYLQAAELRPDGELTRDALYKALACFERVHAATLRECGDEVCPVGDHDEKFTRAVALYAKQYPDDDALPEALFREGKLYHEHRRHDLAGPKLERVLTRFSRHALATDAGDLLLDGANQARDYAALERWARTLQKAPAFRAPEAQVRLASLIIGAAFKRGEQLAAQAEHARAADAYLGAAREFPRDERAAKAYYNAGLELERAGQIGAADAAYRELAERHPGSSEGAAGAYRGAQMYEASARFAEAATFYRLYAERFPDAEKAEAAAHDAVLLLAATGHPREAAEVGDAYLARRPSSARATEIAFMVARAQADDARPRDAAASYRALIARTRDVDVRVEANTRLGQLLLKDDPRAAEVALSAAVNEARKPRAKLGRGRYFAAQARFLQAERALAAFDAVTIAGDPEQLGARLQKKAALLAKAASIYGEVVEFREAEWVTAALYQVGASYERFAKALNDAPLPEGLTEADAQLYRDELARFVVPIEERALAAYEGGYRQARELGIYNRWTSAMREALTRLNEVAYPGVQEIGGELARETTRTEPSVIATPRSAP